jgi:glutaredoxin
LIPTINKIILSLCLLLLLVTTAGGQVYKWTDENGKIHFGDRPPVEAATEQVEIKENTVAGPATAEQSNSEKKSETKKARNKRVTIYVTKRCGYCKQAIAYFRKKGIRYSKYDVETSAKGKRDYKKLGRGGVPIIKIGDKTMRGFSKASFDAFYSGA